MVGTMGDDGDDVGTMVGTMVTPEKSYFYHWEMWDIRKTGTMGTMFVPTLLLKKNKEEREGEVLMCLWESGDKHRPHRPHRPHFVSRGNATL